MVLLRAVILEVLLLQRVYAPEAAVGSYASWLLFPAYAAYALALYVAARRARLTPEISVLAFFGDIAFASLVLHFTEGVTSDLYIAYFLVILASCFLENIVYSFVVGGVACVVYAFLAFPGFNWLYNPYYLLRVSLLLVMSFFSAYVASIARRVEIDVEERFEQQIAWMQRLSLIGQALSAVIHEVKTPLSTIILSAENARERLQRDRAADVDGHLKDIAAEAQRAVDILSRYLEFAKPAELALERVSLRSVGAKVAGTMRVRFADRDIEAVAQAADEGLIMGSEKHLIQVYTNLIVNALDAMPLGGRLSICERTEGGRVLVEFSDTGHGIPPEIRERLFRPFATSRDDYEGHGLGLYIVRWIVQKHRGSVDIRGGPAGKGTTVVLSFPAA